MRKLRFVVAPLALIAACTAQGAPAPTLQPSRSPTMQTFAFLFRPTRSVDAADLPRRNAAAREWALTRQREGALQCASPLEEGGLVVSEQGTVSAAVEPNVAAVLVLQAKDLDAALALAQGHPGLAFGTQIEIRPVKASAAAVNR